MRAEKVVSALLGADAGVAALVGTKIYGGAAPQGAAAPLVVYAHLESAPAATLRAYQPATVRSSIDVLCVAKTYQSLKDLAEAVRLALSFKAGAIAGVQVASVVWASRGRDEFDFELGEYAQLLSFEVVFSE
jgi:hypothetical protein